MLPYCVECSKKKKPSLALSYDKLHWLLEILVRNPLGNLNIFNSFSNLKFDLLTVPQVSMSISAYIYVSISDFYIVVSIYYANLSF